MRKNILLAGVGEVLWGEASISGWLMATSGVEGWSATLVK
jgi:hypothetical protein